MNTLRLSLLTLVILGLAACGQTPGAAQPQPLATQADSTADDSTDLSEQHTGKAQATRLITFTLGVPDSDLYLGNCPSEDVEVLVRGKTQAAYGEPRHTELRLHFRRGQYVPQTDSGVQVVRSDTNARFQGFRLPSPWVGRVQVFVNGQRAKGFDREPIPWQKGNLTVGLACQGFDWGSPFPLDNRSDFTD